MEAEVDLRARRKRARALALVVPLALQVPLVQRERRRGIALRLVVREAAGRGEPLSPVIADICLRRSDLARRGGFGPRRLDVGHCRNRRMSRLREKLTDYALRKRVLTLAMMMVADAALSIDEVVRGPIAVLERVPDHIAVIESDGIADAEVGDGLPDVARIAFERELRSVHADHDQPILAIALVPGLHVRDGTQAVDAAVGPEVDQ